MSSFRASTNLTSSQDGPYSTALHDITLQQRHDSAFKRETICPIPKRGRSFRLNARYCPHGLPHLPRLHCLRPITLDSSPSIFQARGAASKKVVGKRSILRLLVPHEGHATPLLSPSRTANATRSGSAASSSLDAPSSPNAPSREPRGGHFCRQLDYC